MKREEISQEYKWNLSDIYENYENWNKDFDKIKEIKAELVKYKGTFGEKGKLLQFLQKKEELEKILYKLYRYPQLARDLNSLDDEATENLQKLQFFLSDVSTELSWENSEIIENKEEIEKWIENKEYDDYRFGISDLLRLQKHILDEEKSKLLSYYSSFFSAPKNIYSEVTISDMIWPEVELSDGRKIKATSANYSKEISVNRNQEDRKKLFEAYYGAYKEKENTIAAIYSSILHRKIGNTKAHNYKNFLVSALEGDNIPEKVYLNLIETTKENTKPLQRYYKLRKKLLGLKEYYNYDNAINIVDFDKEYEYDEAKKIVLESVKPLGTEYVKKMEKAISNGWLDVFETENKRSGAYSAGVYGVHPYMLLNYNKTLDSVFTLAHELGHTLHTLYSYENQPFSLADYTIFVAEVASTFNERLLLDYMFEKSTDSLEKIALLEQEIGNIIGTFYTQVLFADFEYRAHKMAEEGEPITAKTLSQLVEKIYDEYYGDALSKDELMYILWSRIPHFYNSPFYVYQYSTCFASSAIIYDNVIKNKDEKARKEALNKYLTLLSSGGNDYPMAQLQKAGVDLSKKEVIEAVAKQLDVLLDKLEIEISKIKK